MASATVGRRLDRCLVTSLKTEQCRLRHLELISIHETMVMLIVVLEGGIVRQQMLTLDEPMSQDTLAQLANRLNDLCVGASVQRVRASRRQVGAFEQQVVDVVTQVMKRVDDQAGLHLYRDGLINILHQPEFDEIARARQIVQILEEDRALETIFSDAQLTNGVQVIIGSKGKWEGIQDCSVVLSGYGPPGEARGVLGVLGPMRMPYGRTIPAVRYVARVMNDLLSRLYGEQL